MTINAGSGGQDTEAQKVAPPDMPAFSENTSYILSSKNEVQSLEQDQSAGPDVKSIQNKVKRRKKKVEVACVYCRRSHMICDNVRPCSRCIKRGIGYLCHDEPATRQRKKGKPDILEKSLNVPDFHVTTSGIEVKTETPLAAQPVVSDFPSNFQPPSGIIDEKEKYQAQTQARSSGLNMSLPFNQEPYFYSEHAGSEFSSLNDFLSIIDDPELVNGALNDDHTTNDSMLPFSMHSDGASSSTNFSSLLQFSSASTVMSAFPDPGMNGQARQEPQVLPQNNNHLLDPEPIDKSAKVSKVSQTVSQKDPQMVPQGTSQIVSQNVPPKLKPGDSSNVLPVISDSARDKFFLTAADPTTEISPEERLKQVIKAKLEAGLLQPYNYAKGYARLQRYMDNYMNHTSRQRILKPLSIFRPAFRAIAKTLKDVDLVLVEESFERMLLDYDRVFTSMAIPACLWRRTGEIYRGNKEFASLVGVTTDDLKDGKLAIYELMSEESAVNFWEKYGAIAFDKGQKAVLTSCNLRNKDGRKRKSCCFSFTIRRDRYSIPSCIVGNFIPIDP